MRFLNLLTLGVLRESLYGFFTWAVVCYNIKQGYQRLGSYFDILHHFQS